MKNRKGTFIIALDQSTSATKAMLFSTQAKLIDRISIPHKQYYPQPGFVEHDPVEIYDNSVRGILEILRKTLIKTSEIACLAITNQRETCMIWDRNTGKPVANAETKVVVPAGGKYHVWAI